MEVQRLFRQSKELVVVGVKGKIPSKTVILSRLKQLGFALEAEEVEQVTSAIYPDEQWIVGDDISFKISERN